MAARALYKASIRFGGFAVPVKLYTAVGDIRIHFRLLHDADKEPLRREMICPVHEAPVPPEHRVKGYPVAGDEYVVLTPEELESIAPESSRRIELTGCVDAAAIDPRWLERTYYLGPDGKGGAYAALAQALRDAAAKGALPKAVVVVDLYGHCADYARICAACEEYGVPVIEDAAEALGATFRGKAAGSFGVMGALSFNGNKIMTTSGGGALLADDALLVARARHLASQARQPAAHYEHAEVGYNYRLSNLLAAIGRAQLARLDHLIERRREVNRRYREALGSIDGIGFLPEDSESRSNCWLSCILVDEEKLGVGPEQIRVQLEQKNIEARPVWKPMHLQPLYRECRAIGGAVAADLFRRGLCLPSGSSLITETQRSVIDALMQTPRLRRGQTS